MKINMKSVVALVLAIVVAIAMVGCKESAPAHEEHGENSESISSTVSGEQTTCPIMGNPIDKNIFTEYNGKKVYFCCAMCIDKFKADPEKYISQLPQFAK